jgi:hypothetical protein
MFAHGRETVSAQCLLPCVDAVSREPAVSSENTAGGLFQHPAEVPQHT